jgi:uncharacterized membrane protein
MDTLNIILGGIALFLGIISLIFTFTGLPQDYDTEPLLAVSAICLAIIVLRK